MKDAPHIVCIGSALWDTVGRARRAVAHGADVAGRITVIPGGVALNVAVALCRFGNAPRMLTAIGRDREGDALMAAARSVGVDMGLVHRTDLPTDRYMAIEDEDGLVAAIADARSLELAGADMLAPLTDGRLGRENAPYEGVAILDGNLPEALLQFLVSGETLGAADLRVVPASPSKVLRLKPILGRSSATFYLNRQEANALLGGTAPDAERAAEAFAAHASGRVLVTDGERTAAFATPDGIVTATPPRVEVAGITGAGDALMAAHIAAELNGYAPEASLVAALDGAARHITGEYPE